MPPPWQSGRCFWFLCLIGTLISWGAQNPAITRALLVKTQENCSLRAKQCMLCYPGNKVEATISFNSMDIIGQRGHEIHNPDFIDAPAKPGSGALNWGHQPSTPTPEGQLTVSGDISAYHNWGSATGIYWIEPRDTVGIPPNAKDNPTTKMQNVTSGKVRGPGLDGDNFLSLRK